MTLIAPMLQAFFTDRPVRERQASARTIAAYRDTLRTLIAFVRRRTGKTSSQPAFKRGPVPHPFPR